MANKFTKDVLKIVVSQICLNIGFSSITAQALDMLIDITRNYLVEMSKRINRYSELYGHIGADINDVELVFKDMGVSIAQFQEYISNVELQPCIEDIPLYPFPRESNLYFIDENSNESINRPSYILNHLPTMYLENEDSDFCIHSLSPKVLRCSQEPSIIEIEHGKKTRFKSDEDDIITRKMSSITMNSSGVIISTREGKLPDVRITAGNNDIFLNDQFSEKSFSEKENYALKNSSHSLPASYEQFSTDSSYKDRNVLKQNIDYESQKPVPTKKKKSFSSTNSLPQNSKFQQSSKNLNFKHTQKTKSSISKLGQLSVLLPPLFSDAEEKLPVLDVDRQKLNIFKKMISNKTKEENVAKSTLQKEIVPIVNNTKFCKDGNMKSPSKKEKGSKDKKIYTKQIEDISSKSTDNVQLNKNSNDKQAQNIDDTISAVIGMANSSEIQCMSSTVCKVSSFQTQSLHPKSSELQSSSKYDEKKRKMKESNRERAKARKGISPRKIIEMNVLQNQDSSKDVEPLDMRKSAIFSKLPSHPTFIPNPSLLQNPVFGMLPTFPYNVPGGPPLPFTLSKMPSNVKLNHPVTQMTEQNLQKLKDKTFDKKQALKQSSSILQKENRSKKSKTKSFVEKKSVEKYKKGQEDTKDKKREGDLPKITFKFNNSDDLNSPESESSKFHDTKTKMVMKPSKKNNDERDKKYSIKEQTDIMDEIHEIRHMTSSDPNGSPELARFSALTTTELTKQKGRNSSEHKIQEKPITEEEKIKKSTSKGSKKTITKWKKREDTELITETDEHGNKVWICPACGKQDDGSPMIGCDECDDWYHWICVGIQIPPDDDENWYCKKCTVRKQSVGIIGKTKGKKRK